MMILSQRFSIVGRRLGVAAMVVVSALQAGMASGAERETPTEARRIVGQALCLAEAYPDSQIASDSAGVVAVYQGLLGESVSARTLKAVRRLAKESKPAAPTPVGDRNLAIARCVLFAERSDVRGLLGAGQ